MKRWFKWELALLLGLCAALLCGVWSVEQQEDLSRKMIRLHVIAHSDSAEDQALKLEVRDAVLDYATAVLQRSADMTEAQEALQESLPRIENIARAAVTAEGYDYGVSASLGQAEFPLKEYDGFSLPAGEYTALRLVIGDGGGKNWWCVVFPSLCLPATSSGFESVAAGAGFDEALIGALEGKQECEIRFFLLDKFGRIENKFFRK